MGSSVRTVEGKISQNVVVMRHGDRIDNFEPLWSASAARPWDPPLVDAGLVRAFCTGRKFRTQLGFPIHRVFVSPFLRCLQTASQVISALCAVDDVDPTVMTSDGLKLDPSKLKVSIEYGLCEMLNREAIRPNVAPKDGDFGFHTSELEAKLPAGTIDHSVEPVYEELPRWEETVIGARRRYAQIIRALADKFPSENLLFVTHGGGGKGPWLGLQMSQVESSFARFKLGPFVYQVRKSCSSSAQSLTIKKKFSSNQVLFAWEGVGVAVSEFMKDINVYEVEYCAYSHLQRSVSVGENKSFTAGEFEVLIHKTQTGISYYPSNMDKVGGDPLAEIIPS
ncbi:hypothetical protein TEA_015331 [Camellia sinensis var. sinensis]|uniref:Uncharacterized protein n=1 Tax=Camellia sinensis var. sinensis TaxID=542762 RepID=A0A4S4DXH3_CAMSN|nr:hypothetical protein TEA_015331 [Camellia sinensis var. sinensis]